MSGRGPTPGRKLGTRRGNVKGKTRKRFPAVPQKDAVSGDLTSKPLFIVGTLGSVPFAFAKQGNPATHLIEALPSNGGGRLAHGG